MARDWCEIAQAHEILQIIYDFKENQGKRRSGKEQSEKGGKCGTSKETSYQGKTGTEGEQAEGKSESGKEQSQRGKKKGKDQRNEEPQEAREKCVQAEKEGPVIAELEEKETAIKEKSESGKVQSERKWKGKQQEAGGTCGILKDTSKEGKTAECKQAERMAAAADSQEVEGKDIAAEPKGEAIECEETDYFTAEEEFARVDPYRNTRHSLLFYKRHSLQHIDDYIKVDDLDEVEYFAAKSLHEFLPKFIKGILKINNMGGK
ncbi:hypothetical protein PR202_ga25199 [Eleusine coracana subsp. coracana]|uniref:Uncharacterized protein n=1 Tax=Eleusine coracana subsp. coracana TaxID=191504 RepID=A0AAV5D9K9_ELECO|nr:hypothetical protein PR202_ga25199 [Eleusine coracana subsp. coracana]